MRRDKHGIIIQTATEDLAYEDGGDSAFSTGLMAMTGSEEDINLMHKFVDSTLKLVRHPYQPPKWTDSKETSRDQTIAFYRGLPELKRTSESSTYYLARVACLHQASNWFVNKDILMPDVRMYLYKCAGSKVPPLIALFGWPLAFITLLWDCFVKPDHEMNQSICKNTIFGKWWIKTLLKWHPNLYGNVNEYFNGWRDKHEIGQRINAMIKSQCD